MTKRDFDGDAALIAFAGRRDDFGRRSRCSLKIGGVQFLLAERGQLSVLPRYGGYAYFVVSWWPIRAWRP